jgi:hypothetical protein
MGKLKVKKGMGGSNGGRNRWMKTEYLKAESKKKRRTQGKKSIQEGLQE